MLILSLFCSSLFFLLELGFGFGLVCVRVFEGGD